MDSDNKNIGIIGFGTMGCAIAEQLKSQYPVFVFDKDKNKVKSLSGLELTNSLSGLVSKVEVVILAVKPQDFDSVLKEIKSSIDNKLIISIAAGIPTAYLEKFLGKVRVVRVMPNIGAKIARAESTLCEGRYADEEDLKFAKELFDCIGKTWIIEEKMMDAATAICGSGPAYIFYDMEEKNIDPNNVPKSVREEYIKQLEIAAEGRGFDKGIALQFATATTGTSIDLIVKTGLSAQELKNQVTSKGGTTEAALKVLSGGGSWAQAAEAAFKRAEELSRGA